MVRALAPRQGWVSLISALSYMCFLFLSCSEGGREVAYGGLVLRALDLKSGGPWFINPPPYCYLFSFFLGPV